MKKALAVLLAALMLAAFSGCGGKPVSGSGSSSQGKTVSDVLNEGTGQTGQTPPTSVKPESGAKPANGGSEKSYDRVDIDLTAMSATMVYSEVYNMISTPEEYQGRIIRMKGAFSYEEGDNRVFFTCVIADATACCSTGIEFEPADEGTALPEPGEEITVTGVFHTYTDEKYRYCKVIDAIVN